MTPDQARPRVLIAGGYGAFGARAAERLSRIPDLDLIIAGRDLARAEAAARAFRGQRPVTGAAIDTATATGADLHRLGCAIVLNASGPFLSTLLRPYVYN